MFFKENKTEKSNKKNKGFSLVELIVVIAIMAVLVAVLAPQFTKYIDQSRKSNDAATVSGIVTAAQVGIADTTNYTIDEATYTITLTNNNDAAVSKANADGTGSTAITADDSGNIADAIVDTCGSLEDLKITSENWKADGETTSQVVITIRYNNGAVTVVYSEPFGAYVGQSNGDED